MTIEKHPSLRKCINDHCKCCIYDPAQPGTWRQQVTFCSVTGCPLYVVRPTTKGPIPESVLEYYLMPMHKRVLYARSRHGEASFSGPLGEI